MQDDYTAVHPSQKELGVKCAQADGKSLDCTYFCWVVVHDVGVCIYFPKLQKTITHQSEVTRKALASSRQMTLELSNIVLHFATTVKGAISNSTV